ncbi:hypothetical protein ACFPZ3_44580 [Nonomuraea insulae]|uniref:Secreted protein n=1 Tax=Nonomuraea insulae TaxID=1616787 RepID=A0ABW1D2Q8_9ACTN
MLVLAWSAVGPAAGTQLDLALVEVFLELSPFLRAGRAVFVAEAQGTAVGEASGVVADDVLVEDGDVAAGGLDVEVPQQRSSPRRTRQIDSPGLSAPTSSR